MAFVAWRQSRFFLKWVPRRWHSNDFFIVCDNSTLVDMKTTNIGLGNNNYYGSVTTLAKMDIVGNFASSAGLVVIYSVLYIPLFIRR